MKTKKLDEFHKYCAKMNNRERMQLFKSFSFKISLFITNWFMFFGFNKRIQKSDKNRYLNVGAGNVFFENISNTDLFPSVGQILKGNLKRNSNNNTFFMRLVSKNVKTNPLNRMKNSQKKSETKVINRRNWIGK